MWFELSDLPMVEEREVFVEGAEADRFKALVRKGGRYVYDIVTQRYEPIQHREIIEVARRTLEDAGLDYEDDIILDGPHGARMFYRVLFREETIDGDRFKFGFQITNSYDRSFGININGYGFRLACKNQMVFGRELMAEFAIHSRSTKEDDLKKVSEMVLRVFDSLNQIKDAIAAAKRDAITPLELAEIIESLDVSKKFKLRIAKVIKRETGFDITEELEEKEIQRTLINRWAAYNALTQALTHNAPKLSVTTLNTLQKKASKLLVVRR